MSPSLLTGPNRVLTCKASEFLERLDKQFKTTKDDLIFVLDQYNSAEKKYKFLEEHLISTKDVLSSKFYTRDSYFNLNGIEVKSPSLDVSEGVELLAKAKTALEQFDITNLSKTTDLFMEWSGKISTIHHNAIATYEACERGLKLLPSVALIRDKLDLAHEKRQLIARDFPSYPLGNSTDLNEYEIEINKYADAWPKMKSLYEQADFEALLGLIQIYQAMCDRISVKLDAIICKPRELNHLQILKSNRLEDQRRKANKLRRYNWDSKTEVQVKEYLAIGDFTQAEALLNSLDSEISTAKSEESSYSSSSYSSSGWASSSSDYGSSSSSSDYSSSSSSSDYGSSSGGSDY